MAKKFTSREFIFKEMSPTDGFVLQELAEKSLKDPIFPSILGKTVVENKDLANAYATNKELYPHAYVIFEKIDPKKPIGILVDQAEKDNSNEVEIVIPGKNSEYKILLAFTDFIKYLKPDARLLWNCKNERILEVIDALASGSIVD